MRQVLTIPGTLPGCNEYIGACRRHRHIGAKVKRTTQDIIGWAIKAAKLKPMAGKVDVRFRWVEPNMRRDKDNIRFAAKFILDALVEYGVLVNDNWTYIGAMSDEFSVSKAQPRVVVELEEV